MKTITIRDLRRRWPEVEAALKVEGEILITRDSWPVAKLVCVSSSEGKRARWDAIEHARWQKRVAGGKLSRSDAALAESRAERTEGIAGLSNHSQFPRHSRMEDVRAGLKEREGERQSSLSHGHTGRDENDYRTTAGHASLSSIRHMNLSQNNDLLTEKVIDVINRRQYAKRESDYQRWCDRFASLPADYGRSPKDGFIAEIEIQASRWLQRGMELIGSRRAFGTIRTFGGTDGPDFKSYLPYPVFQIGAEVFLKGMLLYQHEDCRNAHANTYIPPGRRQELLAWMKKLSLTHDLLALLNHVEAIQAYSQNPHISRFLKIVSGIAKTFYSPVTKSRSPWADERYPKRFYNDKLKVGHAESLCSFPEQRQVERLFAEASEQIESVWKKGTKNDFTK
jgi:antitoxin (DNA-binding transcriptional repressor) of toxin-antitoxin stability system